MEIPVSDKTFSPSIYLYLYALAFPVSVCFYTQIVPKLANKNLFRLTFVYSFDMFPIFEFCVSF